MTKWRARRGILTPNAAIMVPAGGGGGGSLTLTFRGSASRITQYPLSYTFADFNCGTPSANRRILMALNGYVTGGVAFSGITVEGNAATLHRNPAPTGPRDCFAIASIVDAANATPDIVVSNSSGMSGMTLSVWTLEGAASSYSTSGGAAWTYIGAGPYGPDITNNGKCIGVFAHDILTTGSGSNVTFQPNIAAGGADVNDHRPFQSEYAGSISPRLSGSDSASGYSWAIFT